ncbi:MAG TPA: ABC transporter substrate-binding protein [Thermoleophilaceae bacterium]|nr:ABC transporter substrate-binding protein [Thermoleophilaceae bacterium]
MSTRRVLPVLVVAVLALAAGACGGGSSRHHDGPTAAPRTGGHLTVLAADDVDFVDPAETYYAFGYTVHYAVNRPLYSYGPGDEADPRPDLAAGAPRISADARTVTVRIKAGIRYAPPVDREVTAKDVKYAFERAFSAHVASPYAGLYFGDIVGAPAKPGAIADIPGIQTPDDYTIVFRLSKPSALQLTEALAMPISTPVPEEYARRFDAKTPSTYDDHVAFTGPYMYRNDSSGRLVGHRPGKVIELVRNPNWDPRTDYRPAYLNAITIREGNRDAVSAARRVLAGSALVLGDTSAPGPVVKDALAHHRGQIAFVPGGAYRYVAINTTIKPFDNLDVRRAVVAAADRRALQLSRGGDAAGRLATHFLPLDFPGHAEGGGAKGPGADFLANPRGDMAVARRYMLAAKRRDPSLPIDSTGRWAGSRPVLMVAADSDPGRKTGEVAQAQFEKLGLKVNFRTAPQDTLYTKFCGVPSVKVAICPNVGWFKDFTDPQSMLDATFNGNNILQQGNVNWPQLNDPKINAAMKAAALVPVGTERNKAWAKINHMIAEQAPAIPWIWDKTALVGSKDVNQVANGYYTTHDLAYTSIK